MNLTEEEPAFFSAALGAGAILTGFCGTFLAFRIQREASYYRQLAVDYVSGAAKDIPVGLSHFSSGFLMLILATLVTMIFGFVGPLLKLGGFAQSVIGIRLVTGGLLASLVLICGYFCVELLHYKILSNRLLNDKAEWGQRMPWVVGWILLAACAGFSVSIIR